MYAPLRALFWHQWLRSRWQIGAMILCAVALTVFLRVLTYHADTVLARTNFAFLLINIVGFGSVMAAMMDPSRLRFEFPQYLLVLPVRNAKAVALLWGYTAVMIGAIAAALTILHFAVFGTVMQGDRQPVQLAFWQVPLMCVAAVTLLQSAYFCMAIKNEIVAVALAIIGILLAWRSIAYPLIFADTSRHQLLVSLIGMAVSYAITYAAFVGARGERWMRVLPLLTQWLDRGGRSVAFKDSQHALRWMAWRRHGRVLMLVLLGMGGFVFFMIVWNLRIGNSSVTTSILVPPFVVVCVFTAIFSVIQQVFEWSRIREGGGSFLFTLPVAAARMGRGWLHAKFKALLLTYAILAPIVFLAVYLVAPHHSLAYKASVGYLAGGPPATDLRVFAFLLSYVLCMAVAAWVATWFTIPGAIALASAMVVNIATNIVVGRSMNDAALGWVIRALFAVVLLAALAFSARRKFMERKNILLAILAYIVGLAIIVCFVFLVRTGISVDADGGLSYAASMFVYWDRSLALLVFSLVIPLPFLFVPATIDHFRHR
jgi:hypothetical protein